ncbi:CPBP family intramembrane metalloprotease [[Clostridium] spiroforme]|nr:CPBP family intramembrane metalloprotease [Thomasclavelia spiroformis]
MITQIKTIAINMNNIYKYLIVYFVMYPLLEIFALTVIPEQYCNAAKFVVTLIIFILSVYLSKDYFKKSFFDNCIECLDKSVSLGIYTFLLVFINITISSIQRTIFNAALTSQNNEIIIESASNNPILIGVIVIILLPVIEELLFKYHLFENTKFLENRSIIKTAIIGIFFASLHCLNEILSFNYLIVLSFMNYFLFYLITNFIYIKKNNLMMPIVIHCLYNAVCYIIIV